MTNQKTSLRASEFVIFSSSDFRHSSLRMQAALRLRKPAPAAGPLVFTQQHGPRTWPAAYARIALIMQRVIGNVVLRNEGPHFLLRPIGQRADFDEAEFLIPAHDWGSRPVRALVAADGAGPGVHADDCLLEHFHLAIEAALIG